MDFKPGLYRSTELNHILLLEKDPTKVTCVICNESTPAKAVEAAAFTAKHGYLGEYLAPSLQEYLYQRLGLTEEKIKEVLLTN